MFFVASVVSLPSSLCSRKTPFAAVVRRPDFKCIRNCEHYFRFLAEIARGASSRVLFKRLLYISFSHFYSPFCGHSPAFSRCRRHELLAHKQRCRLSCSSQMFQLRYRHLFYTPSVLLPFCGTRPRASGRFFLLVASCFLYLLPFFRRSAYKSPRYSCRIRSTYPDGVNENWESKCTQNMGLFQSLV